MRSNDIKVSLSDLALREAQFFISIVAKKISTSEIVHEKAAVQVS